MKKLIKTVTIYLSAMLLLLGCQPGDTRQNSESPEGLQQAKATAAVETVKLTEPKIYDGNTSATWMPDQSFTTKSGKQFILKEDKSKGASIAVVTVETKNFEESNETFELGDIDPVVKAFLTDLDQDGFEELYFITRSAGSGSYGKLYGFVSNRDRSVSQLYTPDPTNTAGPYFEGYRGRDDFEWQEGKLTNSFPVYKSEDAMATPSGGRRIITYELVAGEASWLLRPEKMENL